MNNSCFSFPNCWFTRYEFYENCVKGNVDLLRALKAVLMEPAILSNPLQGNPFDAKQKLLSAGWRFIKIVCQSDPVK